MSKYCEAVARGRETYMKKQDMAIAVISFDKYSDIWDIFAKCINTFWSDRTYNTYLVTNEACPTYQGIHVLATGREFSWSHRVRTALDAIQEDYILLLLEDYLISEKVDNLQMEEALRHMKEMDLDYLRIVPIPKIKGSKRKKIVAITSKMVYGVNLQAAIWKKEYLLKTLSDKHFSAWEFEARQKFGEATRVEGKCYASNDFVIKYLNGIIQGKWYKKTLDNFSSMGIKISLGERAVMSNKDMLRENVRNFFLHHIPPRIICTLKPIAQKMGFKFVT